MSSSIGIPDLQPLDPQTPPYDDDEEQQMADDAPFELPHVFRFDDTPSEADSSLASNHVRVQLDMISLFLNLPLETRNRIYTYVLASDRPIRPHLCDWGRLKKTNREVRFHDDNRSGRHNSVYRLMSVTRVSRQLREESLPVFYSANLFAMGHDTSKYLAYLEEVGRLEWFDKEVEEYQRRLGAVGAGRADGRSSKWPEQLSSERGGEDVASSEVKGTTVYAGDLRKYPRYQVSGLIDINLALLMRMFSTTASPTSSFPRRIVLPVSNASVFETDSCLQGLAKLARGLDLELRFVERPESAKREGSYIYIRWDRKYQKKEYAKAVEGVPGKSVMDQALEMYPDLEEMSRPKGCSFYHTSCCGEMTWYDVKMMGGERH
ncbi:hypothetical protein G6514_006334 [Epicoccum nigrum]|nr:hypothetical protein G6514_006334 [Epicoccum nigrum]